MTIAYDPDTDTKTLLPLKCDDCMWLRNCSWIRNKRRLDKCINNVTKKQVLDRLDNTMFWYYLWRLR